MTKTITTTLLDEAGSARVIREAADAPVIVRDEDRPAAWIVSVELLARVRSARGGSIAEWDRALDAIALELYRDGTLSLEQAAGFAGVSLHDFIDLCGAAGIPILWTTPEELAADVAAWERALPPVTPSV